jgi:hypothetical protein
MSAAARPPDSPRPAQLSSHALECLRRLAPRYVWWKTPDESDAVSRPGRGAGDGYRPLAGCPGSWKPEPIATSLEVLSKILDEYEAMAEYRAAREEVEEDDPECLAFVRRVEKLNQGQVQTEFWLSMMAF